MCMGWYIQYRPVKRHAHGHQVPEKANIHSEFDPIDLRLRRYTGDKDRAIPHYPDPGEVSRALADDDEIILSVPPDRLEKLVEGVKRMAEQKLNPDDWSHMLMRPDFPRPDFYDEIFKKLGMDTAK